MIKENILYKIRQHKLLFWIRVSRGIMIFAVLGLIGVYFYPVLSIIITIFLILIYIQIYIRVFRFNSYFYISNKRIGLKVRNGFFSKYELNLYFTQIKDMAYSKNNIVHFYFDYGTFFARSSGSEDDSGFMVKFMPEIEKIYSIVSYLYSLPPEKRDKLENLDDITGENTNEKSEDIILKQKNILLSIPGIKEVYELSKDDRKFIFENEEDRNHGVYETIKRDVVFCATHDASFRDPDAAIVFKFGSKIIFPAVSFHEIQEKNTVSSSPGIEVHNYLIKKLSHYDKDDATLLIGFDLK